MKVRDIMTAPALTCAEATFAARLMREADCGTLAVVDSRKQLVGIITDRDMCLTLADTNRNAVHLTVREAMTDNVFSITLDDDVHHALATMKNHRIRRLPVCDDSGRPAGMVSIEDVVVRGIDGGAIGAGEVVDALRAMYVRVPAIIDTVVPENGFTPG
jgi:CBS domain-containing protein